MEIAVLFHSMLGKLLLISFTTHSRTSGSTISLLMHNWLHGDLSKEVTPVHPINDNFNSKSSTIHSVFQSKNQYCIRYFIHMSLSISIEPFTITSLLPCSGRCMLAALLKSTYKISYIDNKCPQCSTQGECHPEVQNLGAIFYIV